MTTINKAIDSMTGSRWRLFLALVAPGLMIERLEQEGMEMAIPS